MQGRAGGRTTLHNTLVVLSSFLSSFSPSHSSHPLPRSSSLTFSPISLVLYPNPFILFLFLTHSPIPDRFLSILQISLTFPSLPVSLPLPSISLNPPQYIIMPPPPHYGLTPAILPVPSIAHHIGYRCGQHGRLDGKRPGFESQAGNFPNSIKWSFKCKDVCFCATGGYITGFDPRRWENSTGRPPPADLVVHD